MPEEWPNGLADWATNYGQRLEDFLHAFEAKEQELLGSGRLDVSQVLSAHMRRSWDTGDFWLTYAARKSWAFDGIFWRSLNQRFFGHVDGKCMERLGLLPLQQVSAIKSFVQRKLREKQEQTLVDWYADNARLLLPLDILDVGSLRGAPWGCFPVLAYEGEGSALDRV